MYPSKFAVNSAIMVVTPAVIYAIFNITMKAIETIDEAFTKIKQVSEQQRHGRETGTFTTTAHGSQVRIGSNAIADSTSSNRRHDQEGTPLIAAAHGCHIRIGGYTMDESLRSEDREGCGSSIVYNTAVPITIPVTSNPAAQ